MNKILLTEDDEILGKVITEFAKLADFDYDLAVNGAQVIDFYAKHAPFHHPESRYSLIILDGGLPDTTGFELGRHLHNLECGLRVRTPIILFSAWTLDFIEDGCKGTGINAYWQKPILFEQFKEIVNQWALKP